MVMNLSKDGHPDKPKKVKLPANKVISMELSDFVSKNTLLFFETLLNEKITGITKRFLKSDPGTWNKNDEYVSARNIVKNLLVVNDIAERGIALMTRYNAVLTHQEEQKQFLLQIMENHYKKLPTNNFSKSRFIDYLSKS